VGADDPAPPPTEAAPRTESKIDSKIESKIETIRDELVAAPPFLTWRAIYALVLGALAVEIALFAALTAALR
jgi:hypothetical protein